MGLVVRDVRKRWPGGCILFRLADTLNDDERVRFNAEMLRWSGLADVRFLERTTQDAFVTLRPDPAPSDNVSHSSAVGMAGGEQFVGLDPIFPGNNRGFAARHELGHVLGMFHEQQRRDRAQFIAIDQANIKPVRQSDFEMISDTDGMPVGDYDIRSIMHYGESRGASLNGNTIIITRADGTPLPGRGPITLGDIASAAELNRGNAHIYQLKNNGQLEQTIQQSNFSDGWTAVSPYTLDVRQFLLLLKRGGGSGSLRAINMNLDGTTGALAGKKTVTSGWTSVATYGVLGSNYAFMYRSGSGLVRVRPIRSSGAVAPVSASVSFNLEAGWTSISHYAVGLNNFLLFVNANSGEMRVRQVKADGLPDDGVIQTTTWTSGWTTVSAFSTGGGNFLFKLKASNGKMHVERINDDGKIGSIVHDLTLATGIKVGIPYSVAGGTFLFLLNPDTGNMVIRKINQNGTIGAVTDTRQFNAGWETAAIYTVGLGKYVILIKPGA